MLNGLNKEKKKNALVFHFCLKNNVVFHQSTIIPPNTLKCKYYPYSYEDKLVSIACVASIVYTQERIMCVRVCARVFPVVGLKTGT